MFIPMNTKEDIKLLCLKLKANNIYFAMKNLVLGPDKRRLNMSRGTRPFELEEEMMRLVKSSESDRGV